MSIQTTWFDDAHTILHLCYTGQWDMADYHRMIDQSSAMIARSPSPVHIIHDFRQSMSVPRDFLVGVRHANKQLSAYTGINVYVQADPVMKAYLLMAKRSGLAITTRSYHVETLKDAQRVIHNRSQHPMGA